MCRVLSIAISTYHAHAASGAIRLYAPNSPHKRKPGALHGGSHHASVGAGGRGPRPAGPDDDQHPRDAVSNRSRTAAVPRARPNQLWLSDFTYVATWCGFVYVALVIDAYARRIVGWRVSRTVQASFVLDALEQVLRATLTICAIQSLLPTSSDTRLMLTRTPERLHTGFRSKTKDHSGRARECLSCELVRGAKPEGLEHSGARLTRDGRQVVEKNSFGDNCLVIDALRRPAPNAASSSAPARARIVCTKRASRKASRSQVLQGPMIFRWCSPSKVGSRTRIFFGLLRKLAVNAFLRLRPRISWFSIRFNGKRPSLRLSKSA